MTRRTCWSIAPITSLLAVFGCAGLCANTVTNRVTSPDAKRDAVLYTRDCGATTGYTTQLSLVRAGVALSNEAGNVFIAPDSTELRVEWIGPDTLLVRYATANPNLRADHVDGVAVHYAVAR